MSHLHVRGEHAAQRLSFQSLRLKRICKLAVISTIVSMFVATNSFGQTAPDESPRSVPIDRAGGAQSAADILTLGEVVRTVEQRFPLIIAAQQERLVAEGERLSAAGGFDPSWRTMGVVTPLGGYPSARVDTVVEQPLPFWGSSVFAGYRIGRGEWPIYDGKLETNQYGEVRAGARINLLRDGPIDRRRAAIQKSELGIDVADRSVDLQKIDAVRLASFRYWDWVGAGKKQTIAQAWLDLAKSRDAGLAKRVASGDLADMERQDNQRSILQRTAAAVTAQRVLEQAAIELSMYLRADGGSAILPNSARLPTDIPDPTDFDPAKIPEGERLALARRPDLQRLEIQRKQAEVDQRLADNQRRPAIDVVIMSAKDFGPGDPKQDKPSLEAGVLIDIPLLNRVATGNERAASARLTRIEAQERLLRDRIVADVRDAASAVLAAQLRVGATKAEVDMAQKLAAQEVQRLELGEGNILLVNLREQAAQDAALRYVDARVDWHKAMAAYRAATASPAGG